MHGSFVDSSEVSLAPVRQAFESVSANLRSLLYCGRLTDVPGRQDDSYTPANFRRVGPMGKGISR